MIETVAMPGNEGRRRWRFVGCAVLLLLAGLAPAWAEDGAEDRDEARYELVGDIEKTGDLLRRTRGGANLSNLTLGLFAIHLLNEMSRDDGALFRFLHRDDRSTIGYLQDVFQYHSAEELMALEALADGNPRRRVVLFMLEALRHIPDGGGPPEAQESDRRDLAEALGQLLAALKAVVDEISLK
jgi:hypothetical protein